MGKGRMCFLLNSRIPNFSPRSFPLRAGALAACQENTSASFFLLFYFRDPCSSVQRAAARRGADRVSAPPISERHIVQQQRIRNASQLIPNIVMGNQNVKGGPSAPARVGGGGKQSAGAAAGIEDAPSRTTWTAGEVIGQFEKQTMLTTSLLDIYNGLIGIPQLSNIRKKWQAKTNLI